MEHARCSNTDDAKVIMPSSLVKIIQTINQTVTMYQEIDLKTMASDSAVVKRWGTCQVAEERTIRVATDKVSSWLVNPGMTATFPPSQLEANQAAKPS